ncbi:SDR family NAD(P)-dependent oxidoreductase [Nonomuraea deserti]|uniref:SDR family NAD(P)-dependent oxidoreductase n=1 Tax=Nonomuraea deserti TaxID=1848322 RepID=A0A4R4VXM6_9ACTN|nr:SDR family NAD(P)-dependent oxidoreductase [Nonomuraea deserti]TDD05240.1 SDR family NAD(P)-dependent oxidoreductase [Nonomuraea deserti]
MLPLLRRSEAGRIVNMTSELGSLSMASDPDSPVYADTFPPYNFSKSALNMVTLTYAKKLMETPIKVNLANPGYCATDLNGHTGHRTSEQGAAIAVRLATLGADGPTGSYQQDDGFLPW